DETDSHTPIRRRLETTLKRRRRVPFQRSGEPTPTLSDQANSYENPPVLTATRTPATGCAAIIRLRNSRDTSGNIVLVRIASIIRPPDSLSVQRETTSFTTSSSYSNGIL